MMSSSYRLFIITIFLLSFATTITTIPALAATPAGEAPDGEAPYTFPSATLTPASPCLDSLSQPTRIWQQLPADQQATCPRGFWCPNLNVSDSSTYITLCPATNECAVRRLRSNFCQFQGLYDPALCPTGYYCPGDGRTAIPCPSGTWCPYGNYEPFACPSLAVCPAKSKKSVRMTGLVCLAAVDGALVLLWALRRWLAARKVRAAQAAAAAATSPSSPAGGDDDNLRSLASPVDEALKKFDDHDDKAKSAAGGAPPHGSADDDSASAPAPPPPVLKTRSHSARLSENRLQVLNIIRSRGNLSAALSPAFEHARASAPTPHLSFRFENLSLSIPTPSGVPKSILKGVNGALLPGKVTAIMGPSGAGKTTFLHTLMGKVSSTWQRDGHLFINGVEDPVTKFKQFVGYVPQDDIMRREMTVYENIYYSAMMRLPADWQTEEKIAHIDACISALGISHIRETVIGTEFERGVSGGQRKRVSIGMELAAAPLALFLDEPTTGLDSTSAMEVCYMLRDIAMRTQLTVGMVIHQPRKEIWESLDDVLLLAPGGLTIYLGPQTLCQRYFAEYLDVHLNPKDNPADALMDEIALSGGDFAKAWANGGEAWLRSIDVGAQRVEEAELLHTPTLDELARKTAVVGLAAGADLEMQSLANRGGGVATLAAPAPIAVDGTAVLRTPDRLQHRGAPFWKQTYLSFERSMVAQLSNLSSLLPETLTIVIIGLILGVAGIGLYRGQLLGVVKNMSSRPFEELIAETFLYVTFGVSLAGGIAGLRAHGNAEQVTYWREASSGQLPGAYFIGLCAAQVWRCAVVALHFVAIFDVMSNTPISFGTLYVLVFLHFLVAYGMATFIVQLMSPGNANVAVVLLGVLIAVTNGFAGLPEWLGRLFAPFYFTESYVNACIKPFEEIMDTDKTRRLFGFTKDNDAFDFGMMVVWAVVYRALGYVTMVRTHRDKQV